jgi:hypothetical protein
MRICLLNGWEDKAETEIEKRMEIALKRLGHECYVARTTDQIIEIDPDLVLSLSFHFGKLTEYPTACIFWSPVNGILSHTEFFRHFLTYDAYLYATEDLRRFGQDACYATHRKFVGKPILASCHATEFKPADFSEARAFYAGTNWDSRMFGPRYGDLLKLLHDRGQVTICGPAESWVGFDNLLHDVPFDGVSLLDEMRRYGVVLCLHSPAHLQEDVPTARAFEAVAAGCMPIIDKHSFLERCFGEDAFYIDGSSPAGELRDKIVAIVEWIRSHPDEAAERVKRMHERFCAEYSYDVMLTGLPEFQREVEVANCYGRSAGIADNVTYIVRAGERQGRYLDRCLASLSKQTAGAPHIVLIKHGTVTDFDEIARRYEKVFPSLNIIETERSGPKSIRLWQALNEVKTEFFGLLDDDDSLHCNHVAWLLRTLARSPDATAAYSAAIREWEGKDVLGLGLWKKHRAWTEVPRHKDETRHLLFFRDFNRNDMVRDNYIASPSYLARKDKIDPDTLIDPEIGTAEDWCLINMISHAGPLAFSWRATCNWTWRKSMMENASFGKAGRRALNRERLQIRGDIGWFLSSQRKRHEPLVSTERQTYRDVDIVFAPKAGLKKAGWFSVHERPDGFVAVFGNAAFDGLNYDQKITLCADTDLVSLGNFVIKSPANGELAPREFSDFLVLIHPADYSSADRSIQVCSSDRFRGEFDLERKARSLSSFGLSDSLIDCIMLTGPTKWLRRTDEGVTLGQGAQGVAIQTVRVAGHMKKPAYEHVIIALRGLIIRGEMLNDMDIGFIRLPTGIFFQARLNAFGLLKDVHGAMIGEDSYGDFVRFRPAHALNHINQSEENPLTLLLKSLLNLLTHPDPADVAFGDGKAREFFDAARQSAFLDDPKTTTPGRLAPLIRMRGLRKRLMSR